MPIVSHTTLRELICQTYEKSGAPPDEAQIVADHLVDASLAGHDSHGVMRARWYTWGDAEYEIVKETPVNAIIDASGAVGIVSGFRAMELAIEKARGHTFGAVGIYGSGHKGRIGDFPPRAAKEGMVGIAFLNGGGRLMSPFGGTERRLPPNPLAVSFPRKNGEPIMLDITMSVVAGGKIDVKRVNKEKMPEGWMIDSEGEPVFDPNLRGEAAILPLGGFQFGHKGFGLGFIVDALAGGLTWAGCSRQNPTRGANGFLAIAIKIEDFIDLEEFEQEVEYLIEWVKSSKKLPGVEEIYVPGEVEQVNREKRLQEGIPIPDEVWNDIVKWAQGFGVPMP